MQIYQILNTTTGKSYIGKSKNYLVRYEKHKKNSLIKTNRLYSSMRHYGVENFQLILLEDLGNVGRQEANSREIYWVSKFQANNPEFGYNMTPGGDGGNTLESWGAEKRKTLYKQQADKRRGRFVSNETRKKIGDGHRGKVLSEDHKKQISEFNKLNGIRPPRFSKNEGNTGFKGPHSVETRKKLSEFRQGKSYEELYGSEKSLEIKEKQRNNMKGSNNHEFIEVTTEKKSEILGVLTRGKIQMYKLCEIVGLSKYKCRPWFAQLGVLNYQMLYNTLTQEEWINFWRSKNAA